MGEVERGVRIAQGEEEEEGFAGKGLEADDNGCGKHWAEVTSLLSGIRLQSNKAGVTGDFGGQQGPGSRGRL